MQLASFPMNLPAPLVQALSDLEVPPDGLQGLDSLAAGDAFWMRLAEHLQQLEGMAEALPEDLDTQELAALLAVGLGGDDLPQGGEDLPVAAPAGFELVPRVPVDRGAGGTPGRSLRDHLLASLPMPVPDAERGEGRGASMQPGMSTFLELAAAAGRTRTDQAPATALAGIAPATADTTVATQSAQQAGSTLPRAFQMDVPLHEPGWDRALGERVRWMATEKVQVAELRLNPPNLGPLEVRLHVEGDRTHVNFVAPQAAVRDAIDAALPRLRELFSEGGLNLGDVTVSHQDARQAGGGVGQGGAAPGSHAADEEDTEGGSTMAVHAPRQGAGLVDYYA
jgi:flagellar hook-length control protein FliK